MNTLPEVTVNTLKKGRSPRVGVSLPRELAEMLKKEAKENNNSMSYQVVLNLIEYYEQKGVSARSMIQH